MTLAIHFRGVARHTIEPGDEILITIWPENDADLPPLERGELANRHHSGDVWSPPSMITRHR